MKLIGLIPTTGNAPQYINFIIVATGGLMTYISLSSLLSTHFLIKLIHWQNDGQNREISEGQIIAGKIGAFLGTVGGVISLIIGLNSL